MAVRRVEVQAQLFAVTAGQITAYAHGQRFAGVGGDVAEGVAAQAFTNVGGDLQGAVARLRQFQMFRANAQGHGAADTQVGGVERQGDARAGVQRDFAALAIDAGNLAFEEAHFRCAEKPGDEQMLAGW
jgi:hypothetical protein